MKTILSRCFAPGKENIGRIMQLLLENPYFKGGAVIFVVAAFMFAITILAGNSEASSMNSSIEDETEITRAGSFVYAAQYMNPDDIVLEENYTDPSVEGANIVLQGSTMLAVSSPSLLDYVSGGSRSEIIAYEVKQGDVISEIAEEFGVSVNTILWANNLSVWDVIKPGQKLNILPVSGIAYTVKKGDTLDKIVKSYKGDLTKTIDFNSLPANGVLAVGDQIIIPDGQKANSTTSTRTYATNTTYNSSFPRPYAAQSHQFPWGQCTWYVAQRRYVPWGGNAKTWIYQAPQYGFATGSEPKVGAIMQTRESSYYGHVAYVEAVEGDSVTISEMSLGYGIRKVRTLRKDDWRIVGYIY